jgi:hypothetical protein
MIDQDREKRGAMDRPIVKKRDEYKKIDHNNLNLSADTLTKVSK